MAKHNLSVRTTRKYITAYNDLDDWESIGNYSFVHGEATYTDNGECSETEFYAHVILDDARTGNDTIKSAIYDEFATGCGCEHDCCGHFNGGPSEVRIFPGDDSKEKLVHFIQRLYMNV